MLCETGLVGLACFVWFLVLVGRNLYTARQRAKDRETAITLNGLWGSFLSLILMLNFFPSHSLTFIWVLWGVFAGMVHDKT
jgi:hypothetical protein